MLDAMETVFGFTVPRVHGHTVVEAIEAMEAGRSKALICLGGNLAVAAPDPQATYRAMRRLDLHVNIATKLNRTHLLTVGETILLPCLGRTEIDVQAGGRQSVTVEDSMSMVHASRGMRPPASPSLRSEPAIVAGIAKAMLPGAGGGVDWDAMIADYDRIRDAIAAVFPDTFAGYNERVRTPGGFRLPLPHADRIWKTASGKANFLVFRADEDDPRRHDPEVLLLTTIRSHDQYNTTVYGLNDRYRGVSGTREVVFVGPADLERFALKDGDRVDIASPGGERLVRDFRVVARDLPKGSIAGYYPELNPLVALAARDRRSGTPAYKSIPVRLTKVGV
jgi:molybdopterin-dependent oxidoreductase alpha subunit